jgi:hypothetical protein
MWHVYKFNAVKLPPLKYNGLLTPRINMNRLKELGYQFELKKSLGTKLHFPL